MIFYSGIVRKKRGKTDQVVVDYYRYLLEELRKALPYDAMGGQHTIPILVLQEFRKQDIVEKIRNFIGCQAGFSDHDLLQEIQKFITVHLDPQGIILYMDVLGNQPVARMLTNREDKCGKRKEYWRFRIQAFLLQNCRKRPETS